MDVFDYEGDARRAMEVVLGGGIAVIPTTVGYVILAATTRAINRIVEVKRRAPAKLNAMIGCASMHAAVHVLDGRNRAAVRTVTQGYDLPLGAVAPADLDHPMLRNVDPAVLARTTLDGTVAMLLNAGPLMTAMAELSFEANAPVIGSSANLSLRGTKFRVEDIEPDILEAADLVIDYGLMRWAHYARSSTMINVHDFTVVRQGSCYDLISDILRRHYDIELRPAAGG
jgi:tRNA A37 threonylcarbamoyladenosine synthetase subunit TsaC/SUA5/YrdC